MAQRRNKPTAPDPLSSIGDDVNDPLADLGGESEVDPLAGLEDDGGDDPFSGIDDTPPVVAQGVESLKGQTQASAIRGSIAPLSQESPLLLKGVEEIQTGLAKANKMLSILFEVRAAIVKDDEFKVGIQKQLAELFLRLDKVEAGQIAILGAIADLKESGTAAGDGPPPAKALAAANKAVAKLDEKDNIVVNVLRKALADRKVTQPAFVLKLTNPAVIWDALSKLLANKGHTVNPKQVEALVTAAGMIQGGEIKW